MALKLLIDAVHSDETRVVIADNGRIHDFDFVTSSKKQVKGNIYLAKITRVEPSLQAAFVEYGGGKQGFLPFSEIHPDYYQIPMEDRKRLLEEVEAQAEEEDDYHSSSDDKSSSEPSEISEASFVESLEQPEFLSHPTEASHEHASDAPFTPIQEARTEIAPEMPVSMPVAQEVLVTYSEPVMEPITHEVAPPEHGETQSSQFAEQLHQPLDETPAEHAESSEHSEPNQEVETLATDDDAVRQARPAAFHRRYKIQEVIKRNQVVLVQVIKEERGNKGVSLTTFISLAGRYCVLMPNSPKGGGISRKIMSGEDRKRLKEISAELKTARGMSAIIRTAGIDRTRAEIKRDYEYLVKLWDTIREQTLSSTAPALIYEESDIIKRTIRDLYSNDIEEIIVEGEEGFHQAKNFLAALLPSHAPRVKLHKENIPLFYQYNIEDQLTSMYDPMVKLRSGGYLIISPTEALISIDVNSGRSTGERNIEETATKTNLEAVAEVARQLRLRDLAGLIVIDLIDMLDSRNRRSVERALKEALRHDRAKIQIGRISPFGLMEMSRQRLRPSISESSTMPCPHCAGRGVIRSDASVALQILRALEKEAASGMFGELKLFVTSEVALQLLNIRRDKLSALEHKYDLHLTVQIEETLGRSNFRVEKVKTNNMRRPVQHAEPVMVDQQKILNELPAMIEDFIENEEVSGDVSTTGENSRGGSSLDERPRRRGRRGGRGRNNRGDRPQNQEFAASAEGTEPSELVTEEAAPAGHSNDRGERSGRRRPRRWRDNNRDRSSGQTADNSNTPQEFQNENPAPREYAARSEQEQPAEPHRQSFAPARESASSNVVSLPPLAEQTPSDIKPKKGWWRRIVE